MTKIFRQCLHSFCSLLVFALALSPMAVAQGNPNEDQGLKQYDTWHGGDLDSISVSNGGLQLHIPLVSFPQRGDLALNFMVAFSNKQWYIKPARCCDAQGKTISPAQWLPMPDTGVQVVNSTDWWLNTCTTIEPGDPNAPGQTLYDWSDSVSSPDGASHIFGDQIAAFSGPIYPLRSLDTSGLLRPDANTLVLPNGTRYSYTSTATCPSPFGRIRGGKQASSVTDANGNQISISSSGWTDTMGRFLAGSASTAVQGIQPGVPTSDLSKCPTGTSSALIWNVPGAANVNAGVRTFYFCYSMLSISTNFGSNNSQGALNYGPVSTSLLSAVVLPDLTIWTFAYDNYGDVLHVGFPTGGSLTYTYTIGPLASSSGTGFSTWVSSRTVDANDGTGGHQWTYNFQGSFPTGSGTSIYSYDVKGIATVSSPDGNDVVHNIGPGVNGSGCPGYVYQTQYFQGRVGSGALLKTIQTQYDCTAGTPGGNLDGISLNAVPTQVTTTWPGGQTSKVVQTYDPTFADPQNQLVRIGSLLQADDYDFTGSVARSNRRHFLWQDNTTYKNSNFIGALVSSTLVDNAGCELSKASYGYDETYNNITLQASGVTTQHVAAPATVRGNRTSTSRWLISGCAEQSAIASHSIPYDTGTAYQQIDPEGHTITYTYSSSFAGAYLTQTSLPDTQMPDPGAPIVHHVINGDYDFNTGLLTRFTDQNGQNYTYQYDIMLRLAQTNHPDGGQILFNYPDPNTVQRQRLISANAYDSFTAKFDGVGRNYETLEATPSGTVEVDTTFDSAGRIASISNPYYQGSAHSTDPTYGVVQKQYDALSRLTATTKQDGSASSVQYNAPAGDGLGSSVICTTTTDEARKSRQSCFDALGRLVKVIEPNPGATATNGTGWVSISGAEQSALSQPATAASVTVTIGGADGRNTNSVTTCSGPPLHQTCHTITTNPADGGTMGLTVNAGGTTLSSSTTYNGSSSAATLATALYNAFPSNSLVTMSNPNGGTSFTLAAAAGSAGNSYTIATSLQSGCVPSDTLSCGSQGWTMTLSGPGLAPTTATTANFTGGQNASSTPDTGTITVTINGANYATTFGNGDTSGTIASRLAGIINNGSYASASPSGSTINLTSKTPGTAGNYTVSASYTWNSAQFVNPSFTTSTSGALSGGLDTSALNNNPYVTTYQYNARGNMLCIHQKATDTTADVACTGSTPPSVPAAWRQRFFTYDSLSRILTSMNPETNSTGSTAISYRYDDDGSVISKVEPAPNQAWGSGQTVTITYSYDALNRLLDTTYSDGTTASTSHRYDYSSFLGQSFNYSVGREVAATAANSTIATFMSYDPVGRVASTVQCNPGVTGCKMFTANYDRLGDLTNIGYPASNFMVTYGYDSAARLASAVDSNGVSYAQNAVYLPDGVIQEFTSPNFASNKFHVDFNSRLQPTEIWTGASQGTGALFDKQYQYNAPNTSQMNNGNIYTVTNVKDSTRTQTFTYDALNRLASAGDQTHWSNSYVYDPWGNLLQKNPGNPAGENLVHAANTNNQMVGLTYDAAGNESNDGLGNTFVYDAENRITQTGGVTYTYDAMGRRIQKSSGTNYWYGTGGTVLAETDSSGNWTNYIFFGGQRLARNVNGDIKYYITDHLRSTAMFVDKAGTQAAILDDNDFYPWGGVVPGVGKTTSNNTVKFTGQYRDSESNLDYFGARYYASTIGRFMSPDWDGKPVNVPYAEFGDPQSLNLYSYVRNSPIIRVDADGHDLWGIQGTSVAPDIGAGGGASAPDDSDCGSSCDAGSSQSQQQSSQQTQQQQQQQQSQQQPTQLTVQQTKAIIEQALASKTDPVTTAINLFNNLGNNVTVTGDTLRTALSQEGVKLTGNFANVIKDAQTISKTGNQVTINLNKSESFAGKKGGVDFAKTISFQVNVTKDAASFTHIKGITLTNGKGGTADMESIRVYQKDGVPTITSKVKLGLFGLDLIPHQDTRPVSDLFH